MTDRKKPAPVLPKAAEICRHCKLGEEARALLHEDIEAPAFLQQLVEKEHYTDALRFAAYLLPKRAAVWWGSLCVWQLQRPKPSEDVAAALKATVSWVRNPNEENRRAAEAAGQKLGFRSPAGTLALAAFFSAGSISRPDLPEVAPDPYLTAKTVAGAVVLSTALVKPDRKIACQRHFLALASEVMEEKIAWDPAPAQM